MKNVQKLFYAAGLMIAAACLIITSCTKEGPQGAQGVAGTNGVNGTNGTNGTDANETCKLCHSKTVVDSVAVTFELAKHNWGTVAFEEAGNTGCTPCHASKAFIYVCKNNVPSTFTLTGGKWVNNYATAASDAIGAINCFTCHSSLHTTYGYSDITALTTIAPVAMTMLASDGTDPRKTIDLQQNGGKSNLCVKCHQPRPLTCGNDPAGRVINYDSLRDYPTLMMYDSLPGATTNKYARPSYRMHIHYGAVGAVYAGKGGIEYPGSELYTSSDHTTKASCPDCHMAAMTGIAGGHAFNMRNSKETALGSGTTWNFNGCNKTGCHSSMNATNTQFTGDRTATKLLLDNLAAKINAIGGGHDLLHREADPTLNLWAGVSTNNYDGYLDIYDASSNPNGFWRNPYGSGSTNAGKPKFPSLSFLRTGALINFQLCLREYSLGVHNYQYVKALMTNTLAQTQGW